MTFSYLTSNSSNHNADSFQQKPLLHVLGLFQLWSLEVFTSMFCFILWKRLDKYPKHLYSSVFFLNESGFSLDGLGFVFVYAYFQCLDKRTLIQSTINTLPWFKGEGRKLLAYMENIWRSESHGCSFICNHHLFSI